jgi:hypothetical protein
MAVAISDSSYKDEFSTAALTIEPDTPTLGNCVLVTNVVPARVARTSIVIPK